MTCRWSKWYVMFKAMTVGVAHNVIADFVTSSTIVRSKKLTALFFISVWIRKRVESLPLFGLPDALSAPTLCQQFTSNTAE
jgi:hypothetical protein